MPEQVDNETLHQLLLATDAQWQAAKNQGDGILQRGV